MGKITLRKYQQEAINAVLHEPLGSKVILALAVGLGKSFTAAQIATQLENKLGRPVRTLWLARQRQLVYQPTKYFPNKTYGLEMGEFSSKGDEDVIFSTIQTLHRRLDNFDPKEFDLVIADECHEAKGKQYEDVLNYFKPSYTVGLTGTPFRLDGKKLTDGLFDKIVYEKNIKWGIENGYLSDVDAVRAYVGYDLSNVRTSGGDYNITDLNEAVIGTEDAIADAYQKYGKGKPTLIFATGVDHAFAIASKIDGAEVIVGDTPQEERDRIFKGFENKEIPVIVSVQVMTQGVDLPISEVGIFAKPTKSVGRYQQQVGRILRKHPNKDRALIVDCVGTSSLGLCTAPNLIGINVDKIPEGKQEELEGDLMEMPELAELLSDTPMSWIKNEKIVDLWAKENNYDTGKVNFFQLPDGKMVVSLPERAKITIPPPDMLGMVDATGITGLAPDYHGWGLETYGNKWEYQRALNAVKAYLERNYSDSAALWDLNKVKQWGRKPATEAQMKLINRKLKDEELPDELNRFEASQIINRIKNGYKPSKRRK